MQEAVDLINRRTSLLLAAGAAIELFVLAPAATFNRTCCNAAGWSRERIEQKFSGRWF